MIEQVDNLKEIEPLLQTYFNSYKTNDPYEKVIIYSKEKIIGILSYSIIYERGEINYIVTIPGYRNQGIGRALLKRALDDIKDSGCITVSLEVEETNESAIQLYKSEDFEIKAIREKYYGNHDAYLMIKELR
ncbi:MAG: GNAT family N-acetyltransferase [Bacilli bacterium]|nr:GNAT family N-acetyltransferase [Bacilli bacterium]